MRGQKHFFLFLNKTTRDDLSRSEKEISGDLEKQNLTGLDWTGLDWTGLYWTGLYWTVHVNGLSTSLDWQRRQSIRVDSPVQPDSDQGSPKENRI